ncbi:MAG: hypothetical protein QOG58_6308, partial [Caballeronia sp.]|nr:hypothetical protein [Caballeronia sp.]
MRHALGDDGFYQHWPGSVQSFVQDVFQEGRLPDRHAATSHASRKRHEIQTRQV